MPRIRMSLLSICLIPFLLTGCWDLKDLQEINYLTALGFDIEGEEFVIYGQLLDFASVAKQEGGKSGLVPVWVGKGRGKTLVHAIDNLYRTSQLRIFYGHVNAIVIGENVLKDKQEMDQVEQFVGRFYELRYTPWLFGASDAIGEILSTTSVFDLSPEVSILHQPLETFKQRSVFYPLSVRRYAMETNEPSRTTLLPSISFSKGNWSKDSKPQKMLRIDGAYAMAGDKLLGWFPAERMLGLAWVEPKAYRGPLDLFSGNNLIAGLNLEKPKMTVHPRVQGDEVEYAVKVALSGTLVISMVPQTEAELERKASMEIRKQIRELYNEGLKHDADVLNLVNELYRKKNREWKKLRSSGGLKLTPESLTTIDVSIKIKRTGNMKSGAKFK